ncbi:MAG TPA: hypothetical protein VJM12_10785 [Pyrinomonadaceae bacterium]|nr:hypothetical protein [Pyrinomonadaceae bacterium]
MTLPFVNNHPVARLGRSSAMQKAKQALVRMNILHLSTRISPLKFYAIGLVAGLGLLVASIIVGMASFSVELEIETVQNQQIPRTLDLGYLSQMNYGVWYLLFCPILLAIIAFAYDAMKRAQETYPSMLPSLEHLGNMWLIAILGIAVLWFFVFKNIIVEWDDYKNLSLGWVQARPLQDYRDEMERTKLPIDLVAKAKKFDRFLLPKEDRFIQRDEIRSIKIVKIDPRLNVASLWSVLLFIVVTKLWVGLWEAIVIYFAILTLVWGLAGARNMDLTSLKDSTGAFYHLSWVRRPAFYIFIVGLLVNLFCIFRYVSNAIKGSYGKWDQYLSFLVFSPALFLIPMSVVLSTIFNASDNENQVYLSKKILVIAALWLTSFGYVIYLVLGYINPRHQTIIVACFKPFVGTFKALFGF